MDINISVEGVIIISTEFTNKPTDFKYNFRLRAKTKGDNLEVSITTNCVSSDSGKERIRIVSHAIATHPKKEFTDILAASMIKVSVKAIETVYNTYVKETYKLKHDFIEPTNKQIGDVIKNVRAQLN